MRALTAMIIAGFLLAGPAYGQNRLNNENASSITSTSVTANDNALIVIAQDTTAKPRKKCSFVAFARPTKSAAHAPIRGLALAAQRLRLAVANRPRIAADLQGQSDLKMRLVDIPQMNSGTA